MSKNGIIQPEHAYVLGASFDIPVLECEGNRNIITENFEHFLSLPSAKQMFDILIRFCPEKVFPLVRDSILRDGLFSNL
jgi:hypothetical protein